jgi:hypothetical protein
MGCAAPAAALVVQHDSVMLRIEVAAAARSRTRARPAVDDQHRLAVGIAARFPIDAVAVADVEQALVVRLDRRIPLGHRPMMTRGLRLRPSARSVRSVGSNQPDMTATEGASCRLLKVSS